ncbi:MAG: hypothetical protein WCD44_02300 [Candidatus Babeliales bacterium]
MKIKKLLTNIFLCSALIVGLNSQPVKAIGLADFAISAVAIGTGAFSWTDLKVGACVAKEASKNLKNQLNRLSPQEEKLSKEEQRKEKFEKLFGHVFSLCHLKVNSTNASFIFDHEDIKNDNLIVDKYSWDWRFHKKEFIKEFVDYSEAKFIAMRLNRDISNEDILRYARVPSMTTCYLGQKSNIIKNVSIFTAGAGTGAGIAAGISYLKENSLAGVFTKFNGYINKCRETVREYTGYNLPF